MSITIEHIKKLGFIPSKKASPFKKTFDTLIYPLNKTDYLYLGHNPYTKEINYKTIWKSFINIDGNRISYQVIKIGEVSLKDLKEFLKRSKINANYIPTESEQEYLDGKDTREASITV